MCIAFVFYAVSYVLKEPQSAQWHRLVARTWMIIYLNLIGCPVRVKGSEYFKRGTNYVVVCNHNSYMDVPITTPFMPTANKTIAKKGLSYIPVFGWIYALGSVLVDRKSEASRKESYKKMKGVLEDKLDMVIYPEGTRNRTNEPLKPFYDGAFKLAKDCDKEIMPAVIFNTRKVLPATKTFFMMPQKIEMHFLPPVSPANYTAVELKDKVFATMYSYYKTNYKP